jgi:fatty-acyl-CoA synthase
MERAPTFDLRVGSWIERRARTAPDRVAIIGDGWSLTYAQLATRIRRLANGLRLLGLAPGDRVAWLGPNHPAFLELLFATGLLGCVLAPVNHLLDADGIVEVLADTEPVVLVQHAAVGAVPAPVSVRHRIGVAGPIDGATPYEALIERSPDRVVDGRVAADDLFLLPHTSGTSGRPKGVMLTHANVTWNVVNLLSSADFRAVDTTIAIAPFFRVGGTGVNVLPVLFLGGSVVVPDEQTPAGILATMSHHRVSVGFGNPDLLDALVRTDGWPDADLSSVRFILTGGAPVPERLIRAFLDRGITLLQGYGLSESAPVVLLLDAEHALSKVGSAGRPPLFVDVRVVDADGRQAMAGVTGELQVRGPNVMAGYWRRPAETGATLSQDGWLRTGDAARADDEGFIWIVDRVSASFSVDGRTVYPGDVERVLMSHPAVRDAGVVPTSGPAETVRAMALVVLEPGRTATEPELIAFTRDRLPAQAIPKSVAFVDRLPRNSVGKLLRAELRDRGIG